MSHGMELDLDDPKRCNILFLRHATPVPGHLRIASMQILGETYAETHFPDLSKEGAVLALNIGMRTELEFLRGRRIFGMASSTEARAKQTLAAVVYGIRYLRPDFTPPKPEVLTQFSAWNSEYVSEMARDADRRIDAERDKTEGRVLPDYEETVFRKREELGLERVMVDTYDMMSQGVDRLTANYLPGIYVVVGHAPNLSLFACGKLRDGGRNALWSALTMEQHIRVLGGAPVVGSSALILNPPKPCEGFWYVVDSSAGRHGIIPLRHSPGIAVLHAESVNLQDDHRSLFIEKTLKPAQSKRSAQLAGPSDLESDSSDTVE